MSQVQKSRTGNDFVDLAISASMLDATDTKAKKIISDVKENWVLFIGNWEKSWKALDSAEFDVWYNKGRLLQALFVAKGFNEEGVKDFCTDKNTGIKNPRTGDVVSWKVLKSYWGFYRLTLKVSENMIPVVKRFPIGILELFSKKTKVKVLKSKKMTFEQVTDLLAQRLDGLSDEDKKKLEDVAFLTSFVKRFLTTELEIKFDSPTNGNGSTENGDVPLNKALDAMFSESPFKGLTDLDKRCELLLAGTKALFRLFHHFEDTVIPGKAVFSEKTETALLDAMENAKGSLESIENAYGTWAATSEVKKAVNQ